MNRDYIKDALLGVAVGDAIGVPVEFKSREFLRDRPVTGVQGYGSHNQPPGTWSDDSSLTFCLAEMLCEGYNLDDLARRFMLWTAKGYWTPHGHVFDIGNATSAAIDRLDRGITPMLAGGNDELSNGNGSLMRILPVAFYVRDMEIDIRFQIIKDVSAVTHRHIRSIVACFIYVEIALRLIKGFEKESAYQQACIEVKGFLDRSAVCNDAERAHFHRVLSGKILTLTENQIPSSGYVVHTLEAAIWCLLATDNYRDAVLCAVNLGEDTDTTGAVTGGLAGLCFGNESMPGDWLDSLARRADIENLCHRLNTKLGKNG